VAREFAMQAEHITTALHNAHEVFRKLEDFDVNIAELLGMRNLSSFVGEVFAAGMVKSFDGTLRKNPHQDGYPDLLLMDEEGASEWKALEGRLRDKTPFSPFKTGGVEVKATCGSVPTDAACRKLGFPGKPKIGETRIDLMKSYDWKAHHQETNNLLGIAWDFIEGRIRIVAVFYSNSLDTSYGVQNRHWGAIIHPTEGGGRTTSVSIMTRAGVRQMYDSWVLVIDDEKYIRFFDQYNSQQRMHDIKGSNAQAVAL
jgi:hypothetical protein